MPKLSPTDWQTQPKYDEVPVTVIRANMRTVGMTRDEYFSLLRDP